MDTTASVALKMNSTMKTAAAPKQTCSTIANKNKEDDTAKTVQSEPEADSKEKPDLSKFKLESKRRLRSGNAPGKQAAKRRHIQIGYEGDSPTNKIGNGSQNGDGDNNTETEPHTSRTKRIDKKKANWEKVYLNVQEMRKDMNAPVDTMGCHECVDDKAPPEDQRLQSLVSLMLSSRTKDQTTHAAMLRLREHGCSLNNILNTPKKRLAELIMPVTYWRTKAKNIKRTCKKIRKTFHGDIPKTWDDLMKLPGVGQKMAHLCMKAAWGEVTGIGVDTHVHRIANRLGWVKTKTPEKTRKSLEEWLPRGVWGDFNQLFVGFGQQICIAKKPECARCLNSKLCPFGTKKLRSDAKKAKERHLDF